MASRRLVSRDSRKDPDSMATFVRDRVAQAIVASGKKELHLDRDIIPALRHALGKRYHKGCVRPYVLDAILSRNNEEFVIHANGHGVLISLAVGGKRR